MSTRAQEAQWASQALERGIPATAEKDVEDTTSAEFSYSLTSAYPFLTKTVLERALVTASHSRLRTVWDEAWVIVAAGPEGAESAAQGEAQHVELSGATARVRNLVYSYAFLKETLADLDTLGKVAAEDELPEPDPEAVANARSLLPKLYEILPVRYRVTPTERRGVAIDAPMRHGAAVGVECAPDNTVYCFASVDGNSRRAKFYQMDGLPDVFIEKALRDLAAG